MANAETTRDFVHGLVHFDTQRADDGLDLTIGAVFAVVGGGRLDFGGSEFQPLERQPVHPERESPDDDYGWWTLDPGTYVVRYNETVDLSGTEHTAEVHPLPRLRQAGADHATFALHGHTDPLETLLNVGSGGIAIKENSRISRLILD